MTRPRRARPTLVERLVEAADRLAYAARTSTVEHQEREERRFRRLAARLLREAFDAGVNICNTNDKGELTITAYGATKRKIATTRRTPTRRHTP